MKQSTVRKANKALYTRIAAGIGGILAAAVSLGISLYETRMASEVKEVAVGTPVDAGPWNVTLQSASVIFEMPYGLRLPAGQKALIIDLTLDNLTKESSNIYRRLLKLTNVADVPEPQFYLVRDRDLLWDLQPTMPEAVRIVWPLPAAKPLPKVLDIAIAGSVFKPEDNLYAAPGWFPAGDVALVHLPLGEGTATEATP